MRCYKSADISTAFRYTLLATVVLVVAAAAAIIGSIFQSRADQVEDAQREAGNIATVLAEQVAYSAQAIELVLDDIKRRTEQLSGENAQNFLQQMGTKNSFNFLQSRLAHLPQAEMISIIDAEGNPTSSSLAFPPPAINFSDREYFTQQRSSKAGKLYVGPPIRSKVTGKWTIYFSHRLETASGKFLGVVVLGIEPGELMRLDGIASSLKGQSFLLLHKDGTVLARFPDRIDRAGIKIPEHSEWYDVARHGGGFFRSPGTFDSIARLIAVRPLAAWPFVVNVASAEEQALAVWRTRALEVGIGGLLACLCLTGLIFELRRQFTTVHIGAVRFQAAMNNMSHGLVMFDASGRLVVCNGRFRQMFDLNESDTQPGALASAVKASIVANGYFLGAGPQAFLESTFELGKSYSLGVNDGRIVSLRRDPVDDGGFIVTLEDVTDRARAAAEIEHLALHDPLTGLANRAQFQHSLLNGLIRAKHKSEELALLYIDLDKFKHVNDSMGHPVGDLLLCAAAQRIRHSARSTDTVARLGGDEFAIIIHSVASMRDLEIVAERILSALRAPFYLAGQRLQISTSIGIACAPSNGETADVLSKHADLALYDAKGSGRSTFRFFQRALSDAAERRHTLEHDMRRAIEQEEFELVYQPIINVADHEVLGFEALLRWRDPERGLVSPLDFIPFAEETGLIVPIGQWVLRKACAEAVSWPDELNIAVNLSPIQINDSDFVADVEAALAETGLAPQRLDLEITESVLLSDTDRNIAVLQRLRDLGIKLSMDDFGTGYSSLSYLRQFQFDVVKIDQSFVKTVCDAGSGRAVVRAIIEISKSVGMATIGEGVETPAQLDALRSLGCTAVQGYFFSKPKPASEIPGILARFHKRKSAA
ncbi:MAG: diguanylate cyclase [Hyphomicrobiales bacterium]|nr:diguanylate cyclase [Hyphomicrobiales bacterium]